MTLMVLDEINSTTAPIPDKFVVGSNKRVQIIAGPSTGSERSTNKASQIDVSTPATPTQSTNTSVGDTVQVLQRSPDGVSVTRNGPNSRISGNRSSLKVANQASSDVESFYVTPFDPDQDEEGVMKHVMDISNINSSLIKVTKLVPRGKNIEDLSFVSFKVTICKSVSRVVGDAWYWPDGISVRPFEPNAKNISAVRLRDPE